MARWEKARVISSALGASASGDFSSPLIEGGKEMQLSLHFLKIFLQILGDVHETQTYKHAVCKRSIYTAK